MSERAAARYATLTACQRATTEGRWEEDKEEERGGGGERGGGERGGGGG